MFTTKTVQTVTMTTKSFRGGMKQQGDLEVDGGVTCGSGVGENNCRKFQWCKNNTRRCNWYKTPWVSV